jgi:hypothetical protein
LAELNQAIALLLVELNDKPMAPPREGSRRSLFEAVERAALKRLPIEPYVIGHWAIGATVNLDYHVAVDWNFYSVPYALVRKPAHSAVAKRRRTGFATRRPRSVWPPRPMSSGC